MTTAYLFPGQGAQEPEMLKPFADAWPETADCLARLDDAVELDLRMLCCGEADPARLAQTARTQPAVYATGVAATAGVEARTDVDPAFVAGHSLGHFTAGAVADLFSPQDGIELVARRGEAMAQAGREDGPGHMAAALLADPDRVAEICEGVDGASVAAFNTSRNTVVSGDESAVATVLDRLEDAMRVRVKDLDVGAAFHSPVMARAVDPVREALDETPLSRPSPPIVSDVTAEPYESPAQAYDDLVAQVRSPVDWCGVVDCLRDRGVDRYVEFPPAGTLSRFVERRHPDATVVSLETPDDVAAIKNGER